MNISRNTFLCLDLFLFHKYANTIYLTDQEYYSKVLPLLKSSIIINMRKLVSVIKHHFLKIRITACDQPINHIDRGY